MSSSITIPPRPLFDTLESFLAAPDDYAADRPAIREYLDLFLPLDAHADMMHVRSFLKSYSGVPTTFKNYRCHAERLLLWCWIIQGKSLLQMVRSDAEAFMDFTMNPPSAWVGDAVRQRFLPANGQYIFNSQWRPFGTQVKKIDRKRAIENAVDFEKPQYQISQGSVKLVFSICSSLFDYLAQEDVPVGNPFKAIKQKSKYTSKIRSRRTGKALSQLQWDYLIDVAEKMADENPKHERTLFIVVSLFAMYLRVSDLSGLHGWTPTMGSFFKDQHGWWLKVVGKGNKEAEITVKPSFLPYLTRYRKSRKLSDLPYAGETTPLLVKQSGKAGITDRHIRVIVQMAFDRARSEMLKEGRSEEEAQSFLTASLHWLRHTGATFDAPFREKKHLQMDLRHESLSTTEDIYYNDQAEERASSSHGLGIRK